ncbi:MAG: hypothetical protein AB7P04_08965 [Bacteriovoracia bacterium]
MTPISKTTTDSFDDRILRTAKDLDTEKSLAALGNRQTYRPNHVPSVRTILVVLSTSLVYDVDSLRQKILMAYPDAAIFFLSTSGVPLGVAAPHALDLLIDLTGPRQRQPIFLSRKLRRRVRMAVGRNAGFFRKGSYDRVFDEKAKGSTLPKTKYELERLVQKEVLALAGVPFIPAGDATADKSKSIALELPPLAHS